MLRAGLRQSGFHFSGHYPGFPNCGHPGLLSGVPPLAALETEGTACRFVAPWLRGSRALILVPRAPRTAPPWAFEYDGNPFSAAGV
jgi:hypothetical protein